VNKKLAIKEGLYEGHINEVVFTSSRIRNLLV